MALTITAVVERPKTSLFVITDSTGTQYATRNMWLATLAERYRVTKNPVRLDSTSGWYYRELQHIESDPGEVSDD